MPKMSKMPKMKKIQGIKRTQLFKVTKIFLNESNCCVYITEKPFAQSHTIKQFLASIITSKFFLWHLSKNH